MNLVVNIKGERERGLKREGEGGFKTFNYPPEMGGSLFSERGAY